MTAQGLAALSFFAQLFCFLPTFFFVRASSSCLDLTPGHCRYSTDCRIAFSIKEHLDRSTHAVTRSVSLSWILFIFFLFVLVFAFFRTKQGAHIYLPAGISSIFYTTIPKMREEMFLDEVAFFIHATNRWEFTNWFSSLC